MLLGAESGSYREGKKAIKNLLKQIFLPRGESLLITKQIGRDDKWLYISILFSFLLFFFLSAFFILKRPAERQHAHCANQYFYSYRLQVVPVAVSHARR